MNIESHGADIYTASLNSGFKEYEIVDFSSNINPLGIPEKVFEAMNESLKYVDRYPDINSRKLNKKLSVYENVPEEWIFCSNGAAEGIFRIAQLLKPEKALLMAPTFGEYEKALEITYSDIKYYILKEERKFKIDEDILGYIGNDINMIFICNPNNPTGQLTDKKLMEKIIIRCKLLDIKVIVDECFLDFVEDKNNYSVIEFIDKYDNLLVLKAFTKIYALPGVRLGYCISSNFDIISGLKSCGPPWNVSTVAQYAGCAALDEKKYIKDTVIYVKNQRQYLIDEMRKLKINVYNSKANYIFFKIDNKNLKEEMLKNKILIRSCSNYKGLNENYYRIAVRTEAQNKYFIEKLREVVNCL